MKSNLTSEALFESAKTQIEEFDGEHKFQFGRRFLYSSKRSFEENNGLLILGLNPGGSDDSNASNEQWSSERGNAYLVEDWSSAIQGKVVSLFQSIESKTGMASLLERSITSNLIPFRSPQWDQLPNQEAAIEFSRDLWFQLINELKPKVILTLGSKVFQVIDPFFENPSTSVTRYVYEGRQRVIIRLRHDTTTIQIPHLSHWASHCDKDRLIEAVCWGITKLTNEWNGNLRFNPDMYDHFTRIRSAHSEQSNELHIHEDKQSNLELSGDLAS
jgi:hypothetical protein